MNAKLTAILIVTIMTIGLTGLASAGSTYDSNASIVIDAPYVLDTTYLAYNGTAYMTVVGLPIEYTYYNYNSNYNGWWSWWFGSYTIEDDEMTGYAIDTDAYIYDGGFFQSTSHAQDPNTIVGNTTVVIETDNDATVDMTTESYDYVFYDEKGRRFFWYNPTEKVTEIGETICTHVYATAEGADYMIYTNVERDGMTEGSRAVVTGDGSANLESTMIVTDYSTTTESGWWAYQTDDVSQTYQMVDLDALGTGQAQLYGYTTDELRTMVIDTDAQCDGGSIYVDVELHEGSVLQTYNFDDSADIVSYTTTE